MENTDLKFNNYAAVFIDLLGQREALRGCGLLPQNRDEFIAVARKTIGSISRLHSSFEEFYTALTDQASASNIPEDRRQEFINLQATKLKFQRFSDGLVVYISLGDDAEHSPINGVYGLIAASGSLCLLGLAQREPLRGGLDIAWAVELNENELYGCVVAKSYELESEVAKTPRIVLGAEVVGFVEAGLRLEGDSVTVRYSREIAKICGEMIIQDEDGEYIVDYLGAGFKRYIADSLDGEIYSVALNYIEDQINYWSSQGNEVLKLRYESLRRYFLRNGLVWEA